MPRQNRPPMILRLNTLNRFGFSYFAQWELTYVPTPLDKRTVDRCQSCHLSDVCLPGLLDASNTLLPQDIVKGGRTLEKGQHLFLQNDPAAKCFALQSGTIKTCTSSAQGAERITGFHLSGEIVGLDSLGASHYAYSAIALESCSVCELSGDQFEALMTELPAFKRQVFDLMSLKIQDTQHLSSMRRYYTDEQRVIAVLLSFSRHFHRRHLSPTRFRLPIPLNEMANYLGMTTDTIHDQLQHLNTAKLITLKGQEISLPDPDALKERLRTSR